MTTKLVNFRIPVNLLKQVDAVTKNKTEYFIDLIAKDLAYKPKDIRAENNILLMLEKLSQSSDFSKNFREDVVLKKQEGKYAGFELTPVETVLKTDIKDERISRGLFMAHYVGHMDMVRDRFTKIEEFIKTFKEKTDLEKDTDVPKEEKTDLKKDIDAVIREQKE